MIINKQKKVSRENVEVKVDFPTLEHMKLELSKVLTAPGTEVLEDFIKETKMKAEAAVADMLNHRGMAQGDGWSKIDISGHPNGWYYIIRLDDGRKDILLEVQVNHSSGKVTFIGYEPS